MTAEYDDPWASAPLDDPSPVRTAEVAAAESQNCPNGCGPCSRDSVDVGIGIMYGPWGCMCGWSEDSAYDISQGPKTDGGYTVDQWGGLTPPGGYSKHPRGGPQ